VDEIKKLNVATSNSLFWNVDLVRFLPYTEYSHMPPEYHSQSLVDFIATTAMQ